MVDCPQCLGVILFVFCCHLDPLLHPPDTTTLLMARYLLTKVWLPGNRVGSVILVTVLATAFGFCEYAEPDSTLRALRILHDRKLGDKPLVVSSS